MSDDEKVAGRLPAVKAGGMRIVQHKTSSNHSSPGKDPVEVIGYSNPPPNVQTGELVSQTTTQREHHSIEESQAAHHAKPPKAVNNHAPVNHIQQPRKM
uniref:Death-associated protein 1 n=1 Tax=Corethrella appendiculata TaxID=1370023 RepID=U5EXB4_9DIPT